MAYSDKDLPGNYLIRYWKPRHYHERKEYVVQGYVMEHVLQQEKAKVPDADAHSWCIDSEQVEGDFDNYTPTPRTHYDNRLPSPRS